MCACVQTYTRVHAYTHTCVGFMDSDGFVRGVDHCGAGDMLTHFAFIII